MRVAIVHYHLDPGGVTQVIGTASAALTDPDVRHVVLTGGSDAPPPGIPHRVVPGLGYLDDPGDLTAEMLVTAMRAAAAEALGGPPDVWHFHNHSLGKNRLLPRIVSHLAAANEALLLQLHDLAEQGRPDNHPLIAGLRDLYPFSSRIGYAFLNSRDIALFKAADLPADNATLLPNPVPAAANLFPVPPEGPPLLLAPVRGIRRKNLGELLLLSTLAPAGTRVAVSRAPENPKAIPIHENWRKFAAKHQLPAGFDVVGRFSPAAGAGTDYDTWIRHATHFVTTSVSEGFGMTFLEAAALGRPLVGRDLPHLSADHAVHGIRAGRLYDAILIPLEWVDASILRAHLAIDIERDHRIYQRPVGLDPAGDTLAFMVHDGMIDFGNLPEPLQQGIIERLTDPMERQVPRVRTAGSTMPAVEWLAATLARRDPTATPDQLAPYSPEVYQKSVVDLYAKLSSAPETVVRHVPPAEILTRHLRPEAFHFLLSSLRPDPPPSKRFRAVVFDIYGTLLIAPPGGVKHDPLADPVIREILRLAGHEPSPSPSTELHAAILRHHAAAGTEFPEIDLRVLWREILSLEPDTEVTRLVQEIEAAWHPATPMPGAETFVRRLSRCGLSLGLLSNAQCDTLASLGGVADLFAPELILLSYQHGMAKPSPGLFQLLAGRLAGRGIAPDETLYIGNDPLHDIVPAAAAGFRTALFTGHPASRRPGVCKPDITFDSWPELNAFF